MPEQLQPVIDIILISFNVETMMLIQGVLIAVLLGFIMSSLSRIIFYVPVALVIDMVLVPLGKALHAGGWAFDNIAEQAKEVVAGPMEEPMMILHRAIFFTIALVVVRVLASIVKRS